MSTTEDKTPSPAKDKEKEAHDKKMESIQAMQDKCLAILKKTERTEADTAFLIQWIKEQRMGFFDTMPPDTLKQVCAKMTYESAKAKSVIFKQGDHADKLYILIRGSVSIWVHVTSDEEYNAEPTEQEQEAAAAGEKAPPLMLGKCVSVLRAGESRVTFGELGLIQDQARSATIKADEACEFLVLAKKDFRAVKEFMQRQIQQKLDDMRSFKLFETISEGHLRKLSLYIERKTFPPHTTVIKQGSMPDFLYFIVNGDCEVLFNTPESELIRLALLGKGQLFGEVLSTRVPHTHSVVSINKIDVLQVGVKNFMHRMRKDLWKQVRRAFKMKQESREQRIAVYKRRTATGVMEERNPLRPLHSLVPPKIIKHESRSPRAPKLWKQLPHHLSWLEVTEQPAGGSSMSLLDPDPTLDHLVALSAGASGGGAGSGASGGAGSAAASEAVAALASTSAALAAVASATPGHSTAFPSSQQPTPIFSTALFPTSGAGLLAAAGGAQSGGTAMAGGAASPRPGDPASGGASGGEIPMRAPLLVSVKYHSRTARLLKNKLHSLLVEQQRSRASAMIREARQQAMRAEKAAKSAAKSSAGRSQPLPGQLQSLQQPGEQGSAGSGGGARSGGISATLAAADIDDGLTPDLREEIRAQVRQLCLDERQWETQRRHWHRQLSAPLVPMIPVSRASLVEQLTAGSSSSNGKPYNNVSAGGSLSARPARVGSASRGPRHKARVPAAEAEPVALPASLDPQGVTRSRGSHAAIPIKPPALTQSSTAQAVVDALSSMSLSMQLTTPGLHQRRVKGADMSWPSAQHGHGHPKPHAPSSGSGSASNSDLNTSHPSDGMPSFGAPARMAAHVTGVRPPSPELAPRAPSPQPPVTAAASLHIGFGRRARAETPDVDSAAAAHAAGLSPPPPRVPFSQQVRQLTRAQTLLADSLDPRSGSPHRSSQASLQQPSPGSGPSPTHRHSRSLSRHNARLVIGNEDIVQQASADLEAPHDAPRARPLPHQLSTSTPREAAGDVQPSVAAAAAAMGSGSGPGRPGAAAAAAASGGSAQSRLYYLNTSFWRMPATDSNASSAAAAASKSARGKGGKRVTHEEKGHEHENGHGHGGHEAKAPSGAAPKRRLISRRAVRVNLKTPDAGALAAEGQGSGPLEADPAHKQEHAHGHGHGHDSKAHSSIGSGGGVGLDGHRHHSGGGHSHAHEHAHSHAHAHSHDSYAQQLKPRKGRPRTEEERKAQLENSKRFWRLAFGYV